ncbi:Translation initiation factor IF-2 [Prochlorococcus marinus str. MIT 9515]|uniref:Translation initiation factor IF-2 n=1 Tax=Prochlorococcus marinus (strain MIT 9515) TaxID=167542 RepID=IF2_PROM5|nr:translation initiation factor IF-2 [Prochlorococcus marinus]A2BYM0.1 RecName: Full=Translation initiation factor IF-2 [Prochlorococcus marinus str. MIT 9515]ABM72881.1 Translation initiation factor IF-2 [Prochlorococcus marinus str. MIT 9515]
MTISDKIRVYELSRDLKLENKDILDAAQKLSISVKSHSSSMSLEDAKKIKNLIRNGNSGKKIISVSKSSFKAANEQQNNIDNQNKDSNSRSKPLNKEKPSKESLNKKPLLNKPVNKEENSLISSNKKNTAKLKNPNPPSRISNLQSQVLPNSHNKTQHTIKTKNPNEKKNSTKIVQEKKSLNNNSPLRTKSPARPPIQLIEKPKNLTTSNKDIKANKKNDNSLNQRPQQANRLNNNNNFPKKNINNPRIKNTPELVGAPIRREDPKINSNRQNSNSRQPPSNIQASPNRPVIPNRQVTPNRPSNPNRQGVSNRPGGGQNRQGVPNRPGSPYRPGNPNRQGMSNRPGVGGQNRQGAPNRQGSPYRQGDPNRQGGNYRQGDLNRSGSKFNNQNPSGIRKPVAPNELMQLQKTNASDKEKLNRSNFEKQKVEPPKQKAKAPNSRLNASPTAKKTPHRSFTNNSKKPGRSDWDDSAKLEALRNKNPQKQRQKVHIIGENDDSLTSETSGYSGEKVSILSASLARPKKEKSEEPKSQKTTRQFKKKNKETTRQRQKRRAMELRAAKDAKQVRPEMIIVPEDNLTVQELADKLSLESSEIIKSLFFKGITATVTQSLDLATIETVAEEFGVPVLQDDVEEAAKKTVDMIETDDIESLIKRPPVITVMGHVDHGKTSLLDSIRESRVASGEAGGITQHIGAYQVEFEHESKKKKLTFLDTPGHEAFTAMRARGTKVTDVAVLVVAADDGCRPQTLEAISHARAAKVPIVVAINKIDKEGASPDRVKQELSEKDLIAEDWGGDVVMVPVSAIKKQNIDKLLEMILLVSEVEDLQANPERLAKGTVIEAHLDKAKGPVATLLVQNGTLKAGDVLAAGSVLGKIRAMVDEHGNRIKEAGPSCPVEALGFSEVPTAGDEFEVYPDEKTARGIVGERATDARATKLAQQMASRRVSLSSLSTQANDGELKELNLILKADVQGSVEAILGSLEQLPKNEVQVRVLLSAPGEITETDIDLAAASGSVIIGFNTSLASGAKRAADSNNVDIREYEVIYKLLEDIQSAMEGLLEPDLVEESLGQAEVRATFAVGKGAIAGCYIQSGKLQRNCSLRVLRSDKVIFEGNLDSLKRSKDDVKEVNTGFECGVGCDKFSTWNEGDIIEAFKFVTKKRTLNK